MSCVLSATNVLGAVNDLHYNKWFTTLTKKVSTNSQDIASFYVCVVNKSKAKQDEEWQVTLANS